MFFDVLETTKTQITDRKQDIHQPQKFLTRNHRQRPFTFLRATTPRGQYEAAIKGAELLSHHRFQRSEQRIVAFIYKQTSTLP